MLHSCFIICSRYCIPFLTDILLCSAAPLWNVQTSQIIWDKSAHCPQSKDQTWRCSIQFLCSTYGTNPKKTWEPLQLSVLLARGLSVPFVYCFCVSFIYCLNAFHVLCKAFGIALSLKGAIQINLHCSLCRKPACNKRSIQSWEPSPLYCYMCIFNAISHAVQTLVILYSISGQWGSSCRLGFHPAVEPTLSEAYSLKHLL